MIDQDSRWQASEAVLTSELDDEVALLDKASGNYIGLDAVGTTVWRLLQQPRKMEELVEGVTREFDIDAETARADLIGFLEGLRDQGLLQTL